MADEASLRVLDAALALLVDHDLAASTLAARVAASARAHPYAVVSAGLGALDGPLHGQASALVHRMLAEVLERGSAGPVVAEQRGPDSGFRAWATGSTGARTRGPGCSSPSSTGSPRRPTRWRRPGTC